MNIPNDYRHGTLPPHRSDKNHKSNQIIHTCVHIYLYSRSQLWKGFSGLFQNILLNAFRIWKNWRLWVLVQCREFKKKGSEATVLRVAVYHWSLYWYKLRDLYLAINLIFLERWNEGKKLKKIGSIHPKPFIWYIRLLQYNIFDKTF